MKIAEEIAFLSLNPAIITPSSQQILAGGEGGGGEVREREDVGRRGKDDQENKT